MALNLNILAGKRIVITRAAAQSDTLAKELSGRGAIPMVIPLVAFAEPKDFAPLDAAIAGIAQFDWMILTSAEAVRSLAKRSEQLKRAVARSGKDLQVACVGPVTAEAARNAGLRVEYIAETHSGAGLAEELGNRLRAKKIFLPRSDRANPDLPAALRRHGAMVTEVIAYRTVRPSDVDEEKLMQMAGGEADAILFFSPSAMHHFVKLIDRPQLRGLQGKTAIMAVGPVTASALRECGFERIAVAGETTAAAVVEALEEYFANELKKSQAGANRA
jgi:uroporphyrinogen-III synthase